MKDAFPWAAMVVLVSALVCAGIILMREMQRRDVVSARLRAIRPGGALRAVRRPGPTTAVQDVLRAVGEFIVASRLLSRKTIGEFEHTLAASGFRPDPALPFFLGAKLLLMLLLPVLMLAVTHAFDTDEIWRNVLLCVAAMLGLMLPDLIIKRLRSTYLASVAKGLPDALDLMVICAEAGLPLETSLDRVSLEMRDSNKPLSTELATVASEMKILPDRRQALINLGKRTGLAPLVQLGGTLAQTLQYGTPLTQALRVLANEGRIAMLTRFEERAARLPVLLTIPMILFILPCVVLIVGGPAAVQVMTLMSK